MKILWFAIDCNVYTHPKTMKLSEALKLDVDTVVGKLGRLWGWAKQSGNENGDIGFLPDQEIADIMRWRKKPSVLISALVDCGFMDMVDGRKFLHDWGELNGNMTEKKRRDRERKDNEKSSEFSDEIHGKSTEIPGKIHAYSTVHNSTVQPISLKRDIGDGAATAKRPTVEYKEFQEIYNSICTSLPRCKALTDKRKAAIRAFCKQLTAEKWEEVCKIANLSRFCTGENDHGWKADFDFLIRPDKAVNVLEGRYDSERRHDSGGDDQNTSSGVNPGAARKWNTKSALDEYLKPTGAGAGTCGADQPDAGEPDGL